MPITSTLAVTNDRYVKYNEFNLHINPKAHKLWAARVRGFDPGTKFKWDMDFLKKTKIDGKPHYDMAKIQVGDVLRVKAASHSNDKTTCMVVTEMTDDEIVCEHIKDSEAIDRVQANTDERNELTREIQTMLTECSVEELERVHEYISLLKSRGKMNVSIHVESADDS